MVCERCGYDYSQLEELKPRYCLRCGERLGIPVVVDDPLMTVDDVSDFLQMSKGSVYQYVNRGKIPVIRIGRSLRFDKGTIEEIRRVQGN